MARRSQPARDPQQQVSAIKDLLDTFLERIHEDDLRERVLNLVPVFHTLRDLGSGLVSPASSTSAQERILAYFQKYPRIVIHGDELLVVSGIDDWARRVRELRVELGWRIYSGVTFAREVEEAPEMQETLQETLGVDPRSLKTNHYVLMQEEQDREAAHRWNVLNSIRKKSGGVKSKILEYLRLNAGSVVTGEELRYLAKNRKEWARRARELRTQDGWPVFTKMQGRPDLEVGEYILEEDRQAFEHDRTIPDEVRIVVLERDNFCCTFCGWNREDLRREDPRKFLELHHLVEHVVGGENTAENLITLCNVHHDQVHKGTLTWDGEAWVNDN